MLNYYKNKNKFLKFLIINLFYEKLNKLTENVLKYNKQYLNKNNNKVNNINNYKNWLLFLYKINI